MTVDRVFLGLLIFVPVALVAPYIAVSPVLVFALSAFAIIPLAKFIGESTEELATRTSPALGGLLNATFGNATELIIGLFALNAGLLEVVKASITGSVISNLLFVLGFAMLLGGWGREKQEFNRTAVLASCGSLIIAVIALVIPAIFALTDPSVVGVPLRDLSMLVSVVLLLVYASSLYFSLHTHKHLYLGQVGKYEAKWSVNFSVAVLAAATIGVALVSNTLVGSVESLVASYGWSQLFIGVIVVALIGNAAEHISAVTTAHKNRMELSLQISIGSATQIVMLVAPVLVLTSFIIGKPMTLVFETFELIALVLSVFIVNLIVADGESNWFEGLQLLAAYAIMSIAFFLHP